MPIADRAAVVAALLAVLGAAPARAAADPQVQKGHDLAVQFCAACHVVAPDQGRAPLLKPPAPPFTAIANRTDTSANSLQAFLRVPHGKMPNPMLAEYQVTALTAYIMSLRTR